MSTIASTLLDFMLDLFRDPAKAAAYQADPRGALEAAGLGDTTPEEVADLVPMVQDFSTYGGWNGGRDADQGGRDCDADDRGGWSPKPAHDDDDEDHHDEGAAPVRRDECEDEDDPGHSGGGSHHAPAPAGGTETVVITHLQEVHYTHTENTVEIDASHSIWVSGDAQAIFGEVEGDVTKIDNDGGIVAGDDVEDVSIDNSDNSVSDSYNTDVDVDIDDSPINVNGSQAVDSFNGNEDNDVIADDGGQVGDNTSVRVDDVNLNTGDGTLVSESSDSGNDNSDNSVDVRDSGNDNSVDVRDSGNSVDVRDSGNDNSDNSVDVRDSGNDHSVDVADSGNDYSVDVDDSGNDYSDNSVDVRDSGNDNSINDSFDDESDNSVDTDVDDSGNDYSVDDSVVNSEIDD